MGHQTIFILSSYGAETVLLGTSVLIPRAEIDCARPRRDARRTGLRVFL